MKLLKSVVLWDAYQNNSVRTPDSISVESFQTGPDWTRLGSALSGSAIYQVAWTLAPLRQHDLISPFSCFGLVGMAGICHMVAHILSATVYRLHRLFCSFVHCTKNNCGHVQSNDVDCLVVLSCMVQAVYFKPLDLTNHKCIRRVPLVAFLPQINWLLCILHIEPHLHLKTLILIR